MLWYIEPNPNLGKVHGFFVVIEKQRIKMFNKRLSILVKYYSLTQKYYSSTYVLIYLVLALVLFMYRPLGPTWNIIKLNIAAPLFTLGVCILTNIALQLQISALVKSCNYSQQDKEIAILIANEDLKELFIKINPKKLLTIANNLPDPTIGNDVEQFPWQTLQEAMIMKDIMQPLRLTNEHAYQTYKILAQATNVPRGTKLPKETICKILEYMDIAPLIFTEAKKIKVKFEFVNSYGEALSRCRRDSGEQLDMDGEVNPLLEQRQLMLQQFNTFIDDIASDVKHKFVEELDDKQNSLRLI